MLQINGVSDHVHLLIRMRPTEGVSDLVMRVKQSSSKWINESGYVRGGFAWQGGFGAFSISNKDAHHVLNYIQNQETHHKKTSFKDEYQNILKKFEIDFDDQYTFKDPE